MTTVERKASLGLWPPEKALPDDYKRCSKCGEAKLLDMFNRDKRRPDGRGYQCKVCQKARSKANYKKGTGKTNSKARYEKNKVEKRERSRDYYNEHSEEMLIKQKEYHHTKAGEKVLKKAGKKRRDSIKENKGIPYTRWDIIERDSVKLENPETGELEMIPICDICGLPIFDLDELHLDHKIPIAEGGKDCRDNMRCTHAQCNLRRPRKFDTDDRVIK